ncbi:MAG: hypothetical protein HYX37_01685 [Rhizobiales bacterium]|nr:hypothetical protein [Hyphomicrobiales bacterium]
MQLAGYPERGPVTAMIDHAGDWARDAPAGSRQQSSITLATKADAAMATGSIAANV